MPHKEVTDKKIKKTFIKRQKIAIKHFFKVVNHFGQSQTDSMSAISVANLSCCLLNTDFTTCCSSNEKRKTT